MTYQRELDGQVVVDGTINANGYEMRGIPFGPALRAVLPGVSPADLLRALQNSAAAMQNPPALTGPESPPAGPAAADDSATPAPAGSENQQTD